MIAELEIALKRSDNILKQQRRIILFLDNAIKKAAEPRRLFTFTRREKFIERRINTVKYNGIDRRKNS